MHVRTPSQIHLARRPTARNHMPTFRVWYTCLLLTVAGAPTPGDKCTALWDAFDRANRAVRIAPTPASESFQEGIAIAATMDNNESVACDFVHQLFHNAALFYAEHGDPDRAIELYLTALHHRRQYQSLVQLGLFLATIDRVKEAQPYLFEAQALLPGHLDLELLSATVLPFAYVNERSVAENLAFLHERLAALEARWLSKPPQDQLHPQRLMPWAPTLNRLHYASFDVHENLIFVKRKAQLSAWVTRSLRYTADHLRASWPPRPTTRKLRVGFMTTHWCRSHSLYMHAGPLVERLPRKTASVFYIRNENTACAGPGDNVVAAHPTVDRDVYISGDLSRLDESRHAIAGLRLDILVYLEIGMEPLPYFLAFARLAPVQMSTWCYVATSGLEDTVDYFVSAEHLEAPPQGGISGFTEQVVRFYHSPWLLGQGHTAKGEDRYAALIAAESTLTSKDQLGMPNSAPLLVCAQEAFKYHPSFDNILVSLLAKNPSAYLVLVFAAEAGSASYTVLPMLRDRLTARLGPELMRRVRMFDRRNRATYLALIAMSTAVLDTLPWSAFTTAYEALQMGVPLVTLPGKDSRGRFAYRLYRQIDVKELVANDTVHYVKIVTRLCSDRPWRAFVQAKVRDRVARTLGTPGSEAASLAEWDAFLHRAAAAAISG